MKLADVCGCGLAGVCRPCVLARTSPEYARLYGQPPPPRFRPLPCVHEGPVVEWCGCAPGPNAELRHVRDCDVHDRCTRGPSAIRSCSECGDYDAGRPVLEMQLSAHGIGDTITGMYAACGFADAGHAVVYRTRHAQWLAAVSHPHVTVVDTHDAIGHDGNADYDGQLWAAAHGESPSRAVWYADRIADDAGVPRITPIRPATLAKPEPVLPAGYAVISPYSAYPGREWPVERFRDKAAELVGKGGRVVVLGGGGDFEGRRLRESFGGLGSAVSWWWGQSPAWVLACLAHADHFYGQDSGMTHVAGLLGTPATAVVSHLPGDFLFREAPSVRTVSPDRDRWPCSPCGWRWHRGYRGECDRGCPALASVERV